jgi:6-phosphogluconolactonase
MHNQIGIFRSKDALAEAAANHIVELAEQAINAGGDFNIALAGGSTPRATYEQLAQSPYRDRIVWQHVYVFWSDERAVLLDHQDSNYQMTYKSLLQHVPLPKENIRPMLSQCADLDAAARHYQRVICASVPGRPPRFDLVLLGLGPDGHTASLFPHSPALSDDRWVIATPEAPLEPHVRRITFGASLINAAAEVVFLVAGADKATIVQQVLEGPHRPQDLPAQLVVPTDGKLRWMVDRDAAQELKQFNG